MAEDKIPGGTGLIDLGLVSRVVDYASKPLKVITSSIKGALSAGLKFEKDMPNEKSKGGWGFLSRSFKKGGFFTKIANPRMIKKGFTAITDLFRRGSARVVSFSKSLMSTNKQLSRFDKILIGVGATIIGFLGFRALQKQMKGLLEVGRGIESQWTSLANITGDSRFASGALEWINKSAMRFPAIEKSLFGISQQLSNINIDPRQLNLEAIVAGASALPGELEGSFQTAWDKMMAVAMDPSNVQDFISTFNRLPQGIINSIGATNVGIAGVQDRIQILSTALAQTYGENLDRVENTVSNTIAKIRRTFFQFRKDIIDDPAPGSLFHAYKNTVNNIAVFIDKNQDKIRALAKNISMFLTSLWVHLDGFVNSVMNRFQSFLDNTASSFDEYARNRILPLVTFIVLAASTTLNFLGGVKDGIKSALGFIVDIVGPAVTAIRDVAMSLGLIEKVGASDKMRQVGEIIGKIVVGFVAFKLALKAAMVAQGLFNAVAILNPYVLLALAGAGIAYGGFKLGQFLGKKISERREAKRQERFAGPQAFLQSQGEFATQPAVGPTRERARAMFGDPVDVNRISRDIPAADTSTILQQKVDITLHMPTDDPTAAAQKLLEQMENAAQDRLNRMGR